MIKEKYENTRLHDIGWKKFNYRISRPTAPRRKCRWYYYSEKIVKEGLIAFNELNTRQLINKLWEIKFSQSRIMYVIVDKDNVYFVHMCKKQKGKAELFELRKAIGRVRELEKLVNKKFI